MTYSPGSNGQGTSQIETQPPLTGPWGFGQDPLSSNGLVEFNGVRIHDGSFILEGIGGLTDIPEVRTTVTDRAQAHGAFLSGSFYGPRIITVEGLAIDDLIAGVYENLDRLRGAWALPDPPTLLRRCEFRQPSWFERRFAMVRPGQLVVEQRGGSESRAPLRRFQALLTAPDPRLYGVTLKGSTPVNFVATGGSGSTQFNTNRGNFPAPVRWVVNGPAESPKLIDDARGRAIEYAGPVATGRTLIVDGIERTATLDGGNVYKNLTRFDDLSVPPGDSSYRGPTSPTNSGGNWRAEFRDTFI